MKKLIIIALCLFSMFVVCATTVQAVACKGDNGIIKSPEKRAAEMKACEDASVLDRYHILDHTLFINKIAFFLSIPLCIFGIYKLSTKKQFSHKEKVIVNLYAYSPLFIVFFLLIILALQNTM